ncbi:uncharacterized protein LOC129778034 [Toxorhynchites rutilus septentrionalis]|uniref:uncharacterized protein LOC129778034 n=1 Tax=Toxorhynchites rutilus septentrionalis TaxID=329112 RepID=UPI00247AE9E9|nr:uncharacterized protein LOC129778034 [Toxorhynchites rutilus septentrionalis]
MLRFGLLKYKKLNNVVGSSSMEPERASLAHSGDNNGGNQTRAGTPQATTPVRQHHHQIHNQLNGSIMKNTNSLAMDSPTKSIHKGKFPTEGSNEERQESTRSRSSALATPSPTGNYKPLGSEQLTPRKQRPAALNCKARIYKCIKRLLKRNNFPNEQQQQQKVQHQQQQVQGKSKVDYKEIKSLLEKEKCSLEYDVNLAKCVDKPALIKKIALNLLKSAEGSSEDCSLVIAPERLSETTSVQSGLEQASEYERLCSESWYHENLPRELSLDLLAHETPGAFIVRKSATQRDCYALSLRVPPPGPKIAHYLIIRTVSEGYQIKGFHKEFTSLRALIVHHSVMPEALPVPLAVPRPANLAVKTKCEDDYDTVYDLSETALA